MLQEDRDETLENDLQELDQALANSKEIRRTVLKKSHTMDGQTKLNQYIIGEEIGRGSFGKVKVATDGNCSYVYDAINRQGSENLRSAEVEEAIIDKSDKRIHSARAGNRDNEEDRSSKHRALG